MGVTKFVSVFAMGFVFLSRVASAEPKLRMAIIFPEDPSNTNGVGNVAKCMATAVVEDWKAKGSSIHVDYFNDKRDATEAGVPNVWWFLDGNADGGSYSVGIA